MDFKKEVRKAEKKIRKYVRETPLLFSHYLSKLCKAEVYLKLESEQVTGAFKVRGAFNKLLSLSKEQKKKGVVVYSAGNHAVAIGHAAKMLNIPATIYLPYNVGKAKLERLKYYPAKIKTYKRSSDEPTITKHAREVAKKQGATFVSAYNDEKIVAGQGTIGLEILKELSDCEVAFVCVGGGGLMSGVAGYLKSINPKIEVVGCLPKASPSMYESVKKGKIVSVRMYDTLSDGSAGNNEKGAITLDYCTKYVDIWDLVSEKQIIDAIKIILDKEHKLIEGAAGVPVASLLKHKKKYKGKKIAIVLCGSNIGLKKLTKALNKK